MPHRLQLVNVVMSAFQHSRTVLAYFFVRSLFKKSRRFISYAKLLHCTKSEEIHNRKLHLLCSAGNDYFFVKHFTKNTSFLKMHYFPKFLK